MNLVTRQRAGITAIGMVLLALIMAIAPVSAYKPNSPYYGAGRRIRMDSIKTLTFYSDRRTAYRRTSALPQLTCAGSMCSRYQPEVIQCQAMGDNQWKCSADLPSTMRLGRVEVSCEGYDYADDPYVLKDSCALEYHLLPSGRGPDDPWRNYGGRKGMGERLVEGLFQLAFWGILAAIVIGFIRSIRGNNHTTAGPGGRGGWGGGGGGGWWPGGGGGYPHTAPPPPYTVKPEPGTSTDPGSSSWRPGFWTGLGLGGLAATAAANRRRNQPSFFAADDYGYGAGFGAGPSTFGRPAFGSGGMGARRGWDDDDRGVGGSGFRESTGFGGTRNR